MTAPSSENICRECWSRPPAEPVRIVEVYGARLFCGDFRQMLHTVEPGSVAAVITDPPYGSGGFLLRDRKKSSKTKYVNTGADYAEALPDIDGDSLHPRAWEALMDDLCAATLKVLPAGGAFAFFIDWRNLQDLCGIVDASGLNRRGLAVWDKGQGARPMPNGMRAQAEFIVCGSKGALLLERETPAYLPGVFRATTKTAAKIHILQKPLELMEALVELCPPGGLVFDPFMGSGTTGAAALARGRRFLGCESVPQYFDIAAARLAEVAERHG